MKLSEWLEARVDVAAARHDGDASIGNVVDINQNMLAEVIVAVKMIDDRLARVEAKLGYDPFDISFD